MKLFVGALLALVLMTTHSLIVQAQTANTDQLHTFVASDFHKGLINRALAGEPPTVFQRCPALVSNQSQVKILKPLLFGLDGFPSAGMWKESFPISGCGNDTVLNFYFIATSDEKINTVIGFPGSTHGDAALQRDTLLYANQGAALRGENCTQFSVKNTRFEGFGWAKPTMPDPGPDKQFRPYWETWTMAGCGRTIDVPINFLPDSTGTTITVPPVDTVKY